MAFGSISDNSVVPVLINALKDSNEWVRGQVAVALIGIGEANALVKINKSIVRVLKAAHRKYHGFSCDFCEALRKLGAE